MGLLDTNDPLLDLGMGLLSASGPSRTPVSLGQVLASGYGNMQAGQERARRSKMEQEAFELQKSYKTLQEEQMRAALAQQARQQALQERFMRQFDQAIQGTPQVTGYSLNPGVDETNTRLANTPNNERDIMAAASALAAKQKAGGRLSPDEQWLVDQARSRIQPITQNVPDAVGMARLGVAGEMAGIKGAKGAYDYAKDFLKPDWQQVDSGGQIQYVNRNSGQMPVIGKTMSPDAVASNQLGWANNEVARRQAEIAEFNSRKPGYHDGALVGPDGTITKTPMYVPPKGSPEAQAQSSAKVLPLIDEADKLLSESTGSYLGTAADMTAGAIGYSTKGAQAAAKLKALEGSLMMSQPRMEGPQSDKDVALYRQMAGQIGDSTVPVETRRAALQGIRALHEKYAGQNSAQPSVSAPTFDYRNAAMEELRRRGIK